MKGNLDNEEIDRNLEDKVIGPISGFDIIKRFVYTIAGCKERYDPQNKKFYYELR